jgi:hypothetical protein
MNCIPKTGGHAPPFFVCIPRAFRVIAAHAARNTVCFRIAASVVLTVQMVASRPDVAVRPAMLHPLNCSVTIMAFPCGDYAGKRLIRESKFISLCPVIPIYYSSFCAIEEVFVRAQFLLLPLAFNTSGQSQSCDGPPTLMRAHDTTAQPGNISAPLRPVARMNSPQYNPVPDCLFRDIFEGSSWMAFGGAPGTARTGSVSKRCTDHESLGSALATTGPRIQTVNIGGCFPSYNSPLSKNGSNGNFLPDSELFPLGRLGALSIGARPAPQSPAVPQGCSGHSAFPATSTSAIKNKQSRFRSSSGAQYRPASEFGSRFDINATHSGYPFPEIEAPQCGQLSFAPRSASFRYIRRNSSADPPASLASAASARARRVLPRGGWLVSQRAAVVTETRITSTAKLCWVIPRYDRNSTIRVLDRSRFI